MVHLFEFLIGFFIALGIPLTIVFIFNRRDFQKIKELWESED
jgi:hypothetical protein